MKPLIYLLIVFFFLSCNSSKKILLQETNNNLEETRWFYIEKENIKIDEESYKNHLILNHKESYYYGFDDSNIFYGKFSEKQNNKLIFTKANSFKVYSNDNSYSWSSKISEQNRAKIKKERLFVKLKGKKKITFKPCPYYTSTIIEKHWKLTHFSTQKIPSVEEEIYFRLTQKSNEVIGYSGCNDFFGNYTLDDKNNRLLFEQLSRTKKACINNPISENEIFNIFSNCTNYLKIDNFLILLDKNNSPLAIFESIYF